VFEETSRRFRALLTREDYEIFNRLPFRRFRITEISMMHAGDRADADYMYMRADMRQLDLFRVIDPPR
jgi:hypothetical protein